MPWTRLDSQPFNLSLQVHRLSKIHPSAVSPHLAGKTTKHLKIKIQHNNKMDSSNLLNVQKSLQIQNIPRQQEILHSLDPKTSQTLHSFRGSEEKRRIFKNISFYLHVGNQQIDNRKEKRYRYQVVLRYLCFSASCQSHLRFRGKKIHALR